MKVRLAAWTAPSPVPASTASTKNCILVWTKYAATTTTHHWTSVQVTTNLGPRRSVGRPHIHAPASAVSCTTK